MLAIFNEKKNQPILGKIYRSHAASNLTTTALKSRVILSSYFSRIPH